MPVIAIFAFINREFWGTMIIGGNLRGKLSFFFGVVANLMHVANPAALWFVGLIWV